jgi:hypothetical protein
VNAAVHAPKLAIAVLILALVVLAGTLSYAAYLVVGVISDYLVIGRFMAGLLFGGLSARVPFIRQGKLRSVGLLPNLGSAQIRSYCKQPCCIDRLDKVVVKPCSQGSLLVLCLSISGNRNEDGLGRFRI